MNRVRLVFCVLAFCGLSVAGLAGQEQATPVVTAAAPIDKVRFAGSPTAVQLRIEVRSAAGALVYDSDWRDGNILDWLPQDNSGQPLAYGAYRLVMRSKNLAGQTSEKQAALHVDSGRMAVEDQPSATPKITLTAHDGETGQLITTSGDLSFRFGDFLNRKDTEVMRLTAEGNLGIGTDQPQAPLDVNGLIRTSKGIMFPDGTILTTAAGLSTSYTGTSENIIKRDPAAPGTEIVRDRSVRAAGPVHLPPPLEPIRLQPSATSVPLSPRPNFVSAYQFVVGDTGVSVGTTNPAYNLDVTGHVNSGSEFDIGGIRFAHKFGTNNAFLGASSGNVAMTGMQNTAIGVGTLMSNTTGGGNAATGYHALNLNSTGCCNAATGPFALAVNDASYNTANGSQALQNNTGGNENVGIGDSALFYNTTGGNNTAVGGFSLGSATTGGFNIALGYFAGRNITTGGSNIDIGNNGNSADSSITRIGAAQTRTFIAGIRSVTTVNADAVAVMIDSAGQLGTVSSSRRSKVDISDMGEATEGLMSLRPVTFRYLAHGDNASLQYGLIAEEVAEVYPEMVTRNKDGEVETVMYQFLAPMLVNEVQKQHRTVEAQQACLDDAQQENAQLRARLERLEKTVAELKAEK